MSTPILQIDGLSKSYGGLRPLRLKRFALDARERIALAGFDETMAELFVNLVTGATLPDEGRVHVFGRATADISNSAEWLATVDRFGLVSNRIVLLESYTAAQNVAMSLTLDIDPPAPDVLATVDGLAREVGLAPAALARPMEAASPADRHRVRLARAIAGSPAVLLVEHLLAGLPGGEVEPLAADLAALVERRGLGMVVLSAQAEHGRPFAPRVLQLNGATGELTEAKAGLLGRIFGK